MCKIQSPKNKYIDLKINTNVFMYKIYTVLLNITITIINDNNLFKFCHDVTAYERTNYQQNI